jgi:TP901 family phage tail tape measure protein
MSFKISYTYLIIDKFTRPLRKIENSVKRLEKRMDAFSVSSKNARHGIEAISGKAKSASNNFEKLSKKVDNFNRSARSPSAKEFAGGLDDIRARSDQLRGQLIDTAATAFLFSRPIKEAMQFESVMADVKKVVDFKTPAQFIEMQKIIKELGVSTSLGAKGVAEIVAAGGRLGIAPEMLPDFAQTVAKASVAFDMLPATAGDALASISNKMKIPLKDIELVADSINHLSDTTAAKAPNMINILGRIAGEMASIRMPPAAAAGLAAFADQVEVSPELAASGVRMMITRMQRIPGMTKKLLADPQRTIVDFLTKLKGVSEEARPELIRKMFGDEAGRFVRKAVAGLDLYQKTMDKVSDKTKFAGSMTREFNIRMATTEKALDRAKSQIQNAGINIGSVLLPALVSILGVIETTTGWIAMFADKFPFATTVIMGTVGALIALRIATLAYMFSANQMKLAFVALTTMAPILTGGLLSATTATTALKFAAKGLMRAFGIGLIIEGVILLIEHWDTVWEMIQKVGSYIAKLNPFAAFLGGNENGTTPASGSGPGMSPATMAAQQVQLNGQINVAATGGAAVKSAESAMTTPGDLGFNVADGA